MAVEEVIAEEPVIADEADDAAALAEFEGGFTGTETKPDDVPAIEKTPEAGVTEEAVIAEVPKVEEVPQPKASLTDEQVEKLLATAGSLDEVKAAVDKLRSDAFGRVGGIERLIKTLQESTTEGAAIEVTVDDLKEVGEEYDLLTPRLAKSLTRVLGKLKGTKSSVPSMTKEEIETRANEIANTAAATEGSRVMTAMLHNQLAMLHRDWRDVVGPKDSDTEFRRWLKATPDKEREALASTDPNYLADVITEFKETKKKPAPKPTPVGKDPREDRLREAVPVRGGGGKPPAPKQQTAQEQFEEGFRS